MAAHSSVLAWRIPGMGEPGGLPSIGSHSGTRLKQLSSSMSSQVLYLCDLESMTIIIEDNKHSNFFPSEWKKKKNIIEVDTSQTFCIPDKRLPMNKHFLKHLLFYDSAILPAHIMPHDFSSPLSKEVKESEVLVAHSCPSLLITVNYFNNFSCFF